ncbi:helix-turn-helix transcriptional regulator [candidate division TA06 bacterium]|nr:helix-turn-helix transcriptional regulator [candidate division TA06 bacterium]
MKGSWNQFPDKVNEAIDFLVKNSKRPISSKDVSRYVGMHRSSFCRLFKKELGVTPTAYLNLMRINASKELLSTSDLTVEKIARRVGFPNPRHFRGLFKRYVGESPKEFRRKSLAPSKPTHSRIFVESYP